MIYLFKIYDLFIIACFSLPLGASRLIHFAMCFPRTCLAQQSPTYEMKHQMTTARWHQHHPWDWVYHNPCIINHLFSRISCTKFQHFTCAKSSRRAKLKKYAKMQMYLFQMKKPPTMQKPMDHFSRFWREKTLHIIDSRGKKRGRKMITITMVWWQKSSWLKHALKCSICIWGNYGEVTPNGGLVMESPQNDLHSGWGIIGICPVSPKRDADNTSFCNQELHELVPAEHVLFNISEFDKENWQGVTLPETNSQFAPENRPFKTKRSYSKNPFPGALAVSFCGQIFPDLFGPFWRFNDLHGPPEHEPNNSGVTQGNTIYPLENYHQTTTWDV